jgi:hypothetical protein
VRERVARNVLSLGLRVVLVVGTAVLAGAADYYRLPDIKRIRRDLYRSAEVVIETRSCLHRPEDEEALLKYAGPGDYEIVWKDNSTCKVQRVAVLEVSQL